MSSVLFELCVRQEFLWQVIQRTEKRWTGFKQIRAGANAVKCGRKGRARCEAHSLGMAAATLALASKEDLTLSNQDSELAIKNEGSRIATSPTGE